MLTQDRDEELVLFLEIRRHEKSHQGSDNSSSKTTMSSRHYPPRKTAADNFLYAENEKSDYDWLVTPPGSPTKSLMNQLDAPDVNLMALESRLLNYNEERDNNLAPKSQTIGLKRPSSSNSSRSTSRPSTPTQRPTTRAARSTTPTTRVTSTTTRPTLSSSSASSSRPSTPSTRPSSSGTSRATSTVARATLASSSTSSSRPSTPTSRPSSSGTSRATSTVARATLASSSTSSSRPSTPTSRPSSSGTSRANLTAARATLTSPATRPSTPTRRPSSSGTSRAKLPISAPNSKPGSRTNTPTRRPSTPTGPSLIPRSKPMSIPVASPIPRSRPWEPYEMPGFSLEAPSNLRTTLPDRPQTASSRITRAFGASSGSSSRSSSIERGVSSRQSCSPSRNRAPIGNVNGDVPVTRVVNTRKLAPPPLTEHGGGSFARKSSSGSNGFGFGRNISKSSIDMAVRHMDITPGSMKGNFRPVVTKVPAASLYSVRQSGTRRNRPASSSGSSESSVNILCLDDDNISDISYP